MYIPLYTDIKALIKSLGETNDIFSKDGRSFKKKEIILIDDSNEEVINSSKKKFHDKN